MYSQVQRDGNVSSTAAESADHSSLAVGGVKRDGVGGMRDEDAINYYLLEVHCGQ